MMYDTNLPRRLRALLAGLAGFTSVAAITAVLPLHPVYAQEDEGEDEDETETIEDKVADYEAMEGLFPLWQDPEDGTVYIEVSEDQLGEEFIAFSYTENGVVEAGHFRGAYQDQRILSFEKRYGSIDVIEKNTAFYFDEASALSRANDANISDALLASIEIVAETEGTEATGEDEEGTPARYLIKADELFLNESLHQVKGSPNPDAPPRSFSLGELSSGKTHYADVRNYPENTDFIVDYVYDNPKPMNYGDWEVTDARAVTIRMQHSLIALPEEGFTPRFDDYRVGYFFDQVTDLTSPDATPYRDMINRWRLVKQDPDADISDPVEPITWWIENTTPVEYREIIEEAALAWNEAFETAGFSNAVTVAVQPDDAEWDAGDIRYNVLRWTSSPNPPFGGYGPSFTNPRTGEIIGADVMLEYVFVTNRLLYTELFNAAAMLDGGMPEMPAALQDKYGLCDISMHLHTDLAFAQLAAVQAGASDEEVSQLVNDGLHYLILHELGHTLGLNHNMKASQLWDAREVHDKEITQGIIAGSVMDYPALNVAPVGVEQGNYANRRPGPYDHWAIEFGYSPEIDYPQARAALLARSVEPELTFGNDADDMRSAGGGGIDPRVMIGDMSSDMVTYGRDRVELIKSLLPGLKDHYAGKDSYEPLLNAYLVLTSNQANMAASVSRHIGGVYVERATPGQEGAPQPFTPVSRSTQKDAMSMLADTVFAADAFDMPEELAAALQTQRRGFGFFGTGEDPKIHERALGIQSSILNHLMSANVLGRMTNYQTYGGDYAPAEMLLDLNEAVFGGDLTGNPNTFRQNLQVEYTKRLVRIVGDNSYDPIAQSAALAAIKDVNSRAGWFAFGQSAAAAAHRDHIKGIIKPVIEAI